MASESFVSLFCPSCGQKLSIPTGDLRRQFRCPRCDAIDTAANLVPRQEALAAVPLEVNGASLEAQPPDRRDISDAGPRGVTDAPSQEREPGPAAAVELPTARSEDLARPAQRTRGSLVLRAVRAVLGLAERFDARTYGNRLTVVYALSCVYCIAALVATALKLPLVEAIALGLFFGALVVYGLARVSMFRGEDGGWTWRTGLRGLRGAIGRGWETLGDWWQLPTHERQATYTSLMVMGGCLVIAVRALFAWLLAPQDSIVFLTWAFVGWGLVGLGLWRWYKRRDLRGGSRRVSRSLPAAGALQAAGQRMPAVIDLVRDREAQVRRARAEYEPYLARLIEVLACWSPRPRGEPLEADYHASLHRHLRKVAPGLRVERERPVESRAERTRRRIDLAVDDCVAIELKRRLTRASDLDRAFGQLDTYAEVWKNGPVLLVVCETGPEFAQTLGLQARIERLRAMGCSIVAIAAGRPARA